MTQEQLTEEAIARGISRGITQAAGATIGWGSLIIGGVAFVVLKHSPAIVSAVANATVAPVANRFFPGRNSGSPMEKIPHHTENAVAGFATTEAFLPCLKADKSDCRTWDNPNGRPHNGADISTPTGTPLYAIGIDGDEVTVTCSGVVTDTTGYGVLAVIESPSLDVYFYAGHLNTCNPGIYRPGEKFGTTGNSGYSTGPHLHWEERRKSDDKPQDPALAYAESALSGKKLKLEATVGGSDFDQALDFIFDVEGECSDHPDDRGGWTCYGITAAVAARHGITPADVNHDIARDIYFSDYWAGVCDHLPHPLSMACLNTSVNSGPGKAREFNALIGDRDVVTESIEYLNRQRAYYAAIIARDPSQRVFEAGWANRSDSLEQRLKAMR